jgi:hypothetical protein
MIVTCSLRVLDGFDTIDLFEQAWHRVRARVNMNVCWARHGQHTTVCLQVCEIPCKHARDV